MELQFSSVADLKKRIMPALKIRVKNMKSDNIECSEEELWNYFVDFWKDSHDLTLADMVDDILNKPIDDKIM